MKMLRAITAIAFLLVCGPAYAQWQAPNHSIPLGRGLGVTGFGSAAPSTAGQPFVSQGASADPAFGTIANSGFAAGAADTYKGSLNGTTVTDVPRAPCTSVSQALRYTAGVGESCGNIIVQTGFDMPVNFGLSVPAPSGGALVISLTQANGSAPSSANPVLVPFRSTVLTTGTITWATISAPQSITIPSGATLGTSNNVPFTVWIFENYNGGTPELGVATCSNPTTIFACSSWESTLVTSTAISSGATAAGTMYATTGVTLDAVRIIGSCEFSAGLSAAGTWSSTCTTLQPFGVGIKKPGDVVQTVSFSTASAVSVSNNTKVATNLVASITMRSNADLIRVHANGTLGAPATTGASAFAAMWRNTGTVQVGNIGVVFSQVSSQPAENMTPLDALDGPAASNWPATQYGVYIALTTASGATYSFPSTAISGANSGVITLDEIKG